MLLLLRTRYLRSTVAVRGLWWAFLEDVGAFCLLCLNVIESCLFCLLYRRARSFVILACFAQKRRRSWSFGALCNAAAQYSDSLSFGFIGTTWTNAHLLCVTWLWRLCLFYSVINFEDLACGGDFAFSPLFSEEWAHVFVFRLRTCS